MTEVEHRRVLMRDGSEAGYSLRPTAEELNPKEPTTRAGQRWCFEYVRSACARLRATRTCAPPTRR